MKTIIIPTDFSKNALKAFDFASDFFTGSDYQYLICTTYTIPSGGTSSLFSLLEQLRLQAEEEMNQFMELIKKDYPLIYQSSKSFVLQGWFTGQVNALAQEEMADFVIMGTKGASGMKEVLLGSHAADLINDLSIPVFAIPFEYEKSKLKSILFSYDGNSLTDKTVSFINGLSKGFDLPINLFHVRRKADAPIQNWGAIEDQFNNRHISLYEAFADTYEEGLKSKIADLNAILVLVSRKKSFWDRLMKRGQSKKAIMHLHMPMLVLPEKG
ncbi:MAG: universal stress protein [Flavobacteriales bacterium]|nr:universal stress protein [Flavobacteriales bacterium]